MKLYYSKGACSLAVRIIINELGVQSEYESVNLKTKKTENGEDFLKINPEGAVPVIVTDNGEKLTENIAIQIYLAEKYNAITLLPNKDNFKRYRTLAWLSFVATELHKRFGALFNQSVPEEYRNKFAIPELKKKLGFVDQHLQENEYLTGVEFSLPDSYLFVIIRWANHFKILDEFKNIMRYFNELKKRKSVQLALEQEELSVAL